MTREREWFVLWIAVGAMVVLVLAAIAAVVVG